MTGTRKGFGNLKPKVGGHDSLRLDELIQIYQFPKDEWLQVRFLDEDILAVKRHWIKILTGKDKKETRVPRFCVAFDPQNESEPLAGVHCPYCDLSTGEHGSSNYENFYLVNAIIRELQEEEPAKKARPTKTEQETGFKDIRSKSWTPVRVLRIPPTVAARMQELGENNIVKNKTGAKKAFDISHPKFGIDINIKFKPKGSGSDKYSADKAEDGRTPITEEEQAYLTWQLPSELLDQAGRLSPKQAEEDFKRMEIVGGEEIDSDDDDEDDDDIDLSNRSRKKPVAKKSRRPVEDDDDEDEDEDDEPPRSRKKPVAKKSSKWNEDEDDEDDDDEDDEPPRSRKKPVAKKSRRPVEDDDDEDEDEDDEPPRSRKKPVAKKSSKWDEDDDDDDEDEDEDDVPPRSRKKPVAKKSSKWDDDDDEDDEDEDDDDDIKLSSRSRKKPVAKKSSKWDEDDDDEDDEDEDDEPPRSRKKPVAKKSRRPVEDDDDEDEDDDWDDE